MIAKELLQSLSENKENTILMASILSDFLCTKPVFNDFLQVFVKNYNLIAPKVEEISKNPIFVECYKTFLKTQTDIGIIPFRHHSVSTSLNEGLHAVFFTDQFEVLPYRTPRNSNYAKFGDFVVKIKEGFLYIECKTKLNLTEIAYENFFKLTKNYEQNKILQVIYIEKENTLTLLDNMQFNFLDIHKKEFFINQRNVN